MRIIEWNINQATNVSNNNIVPKFVVDEVIKNNPDIFILTEFAKTKNYEDIRRQICNNGFSFEVTSNANCKQNEVMIAWRNDKFTVDKNDIVNPPAQNDMPEVLIVPLEWNGINMIVTGLRIKLFGDKYLMRKRQLENIMDLISKQFGKCMYLIVGGDFNNNKSDYKRSNWGEEWSLGVIDSIAKKNECIRKTPNPVEGSSIYQKSKYPLFQEDHYLVSKGIKVNGVHYFRDFTKFYPDVYLHGEDFRVYNPRLRAVIWTIPFGSGIPDHAMLIADFELLERVESKDEQKRQE